MIKIILTIAIILSLTGCKERTMNYVSYKYAECESPIGETVGIILSNDGVYRCIKPEHKVKSVFYIATKKEKAIKNNTFKNPSWLDIEPIEKCETTITNIYKNGTVRCKGKILEVGQKTRVVRVNK